MIILKEYLSFRDIGIRANNFGDFGPLFYLKKKINLEEFQIINGQTGDFIAGNHLPIEILRKKITILGIN